MSFGSNASLTAEMTLTGPCGQAYNVILAALSETSLDLYQRELSMRAWANNLENEEALNERIIRVNLYYQKTEDGQ
jgi:hypothetical protein